MKRRRIYICGPMRGLPDFNYPTFNHYAAAHREVGWDVVNPVEIGAQYGTAEEINGNPELLRAVMAHDINSLKTCDAIFLLEGWQKSEGAKKELAAALALSLEITLAPNIIIPLYRRELP